nr:type II secretion system F family protein [Candidatus Hamiltonella defensa]
MMFFIFIILCFLGTTLLFYSFDRKKRISVYKKVNDKKVETQKNKPALKTKTTYSVIKIPDFLLEKNKIIFCITSLFALIFAAALFFWKIEYSKNILITLFLTSSIFSIGFYQLLIKSIIFRKTRLMLSSFPFFIDMTAACIQAGMTIENALTYSAENFYKINEDIASLIMQVVRKAEVHGLENAIKTLYQEVSFLEIKMFCNAVQNSVDFGSSVYEHLMKFSTDIREMQLMESEEKISKLSVKLTLILFLFILIPFILLIISPTALELFLGDQFL